MSDNEKYLHRTVDVTLDDVLQARDNRAKKQRDMLAKHQCPLLSMTMNIPGSVKRTPHASYYFREELERLKRHLKAMDAAVVGEYTSTRSTGEEAILSISGLSTYSLKKLTVFLEERTEVSRLLDIDVLDEEGNHVTRASIGLEARKCLLCENPAKICGRARTHSLTDLIAETSRRLGEAVRDSFVERIVALASRASSFEVLVHPKPGLVTSFDCGSHDDMDRFTFAKSQAALLTYYKRVFTMGWEGIGTEERIEKLRIEGIEAEQVMFDATSGVNTHRGWIYLSGILLASAGLWFSNIFNEVKVDELGKDACELFSRTTARVARALERSLASPFFENVRETLATHRSLAVDHDPLYSDSLNLVGIRKEAVLGFPSLFNFGYPIVMCSQLQVEGENVAGQRAILALLSVVDDTTLLNRAGASLARQVRQRARASINCQLEEDEALIVSRAFAISEEELHEEMLALSQYFSEHGLSCGGVADLLAGSFLVRDLLCFYEDILH